MLCHRSADICCTVVSVLHTMVQSCVVLLVGVILVGEKEAARLCRRETIPMVVDSTRAQHVRAAVTTDGVR